MDSHASCSLSLSLDSMAYSNSELSGDGSKMSGLNDILSRSFEPMITPLVERAEAVNKIKDATPSRQLTLTPSKSTLFQHLDPEKCHKSAYFDKVSDEVDSIEAVDDEAQIQRHLDFSDSSLTFPQQEDPSDDEPTRYAIGTELCKVNTSRKQKCLTKMNWRKQVFKAKIRNSSLAKIGKRVKQFLPAKHECQKNLPIYNCKACAKDRRSI